MKFSETGFFKKGPNWIALALALAAAIFMWVLVTQKDEIEAQIEVSLNYVNIPPNLVVTNGMVSKLYVRVRGPKVLVNALLREPNSDVLSLANIKQGETVIPLSMGDISLYPKLRSISIIDIQPPRLVIVADAVAERRVRVEVDLSSPLRKGAVSFEEVGVFPNIVTLRGPRQTLENYPPIRLELNLDLSKAPGETVTQRIALDTPNFVTAEPNSVDVRYKITSGRAALKRACKVMIAQGSDASQYEIEPPEVEVDIEVPENLAHSQSYLSGLEASVLLPDIQAGESEILKVNIHTPAGMTWSAVTPAEVAVTHK